MEEFSVIEHAGENMDKKVYWFELHGIHFCF